MIIGVTGGIGSGKSTVSHVLGDLGAKVIDADRIAREVVNKGEKAFSEIVEYFGEQVLDGSGDLDRKKLAGIVFDDPQKLEVLNSITHKYIVDRIIGQIKAAGEENSQVIVLDVPIPVKHGFLDLVDEVWVVMTDRETRIKRIMQRSAISYDEAFKRVNSQIKDEEYLKLADQVLHNNGSVEELEQSVVKLFLQKKSK